jgi:YD repeat-containing protein
LNFAPLYSLNSIEYNEVGLAKKVTNAIGNSITNTYDSHNRLTHAIDNFGADTETIYSDNGTVRKTIDAQGHDTEYAYDGNNRHTHSHQSHERQQNRQNYRCQRAQHLTVYDLQNNFRQSASVRDFADVPRL